jgi:RNA polymerase sigma factor (sigma-70 family)
MDDLDFVKKCTSADMLAWKEFLQKYSRLIYSYIHNIIRIKGYIFDASVIEDIFHEIISSLIKDDYRKLKTYQNRNSATLASWLRQVTINFCLTYFRQEKPAMVSLDAPNEEGLALSEIIPYRSLSAVEQLLQKERKENLTDCIERLDLDDKFILELTLKWEFSLGELKDLLGISRGAMDMRHSRIIQRLRDCFKEKGFEFTQSD